jgi:1-acyl-sn-glycerol-3-phosphate acyltransferase
MLRRSSRLLLFLACALAAVGDGLLPRRDRAVWRQKWAGRFRTVLKLRVTVSGRVPRRGLIVANHLGYLDILALLAAAPCVFVAKREVKSWFLLGPLAALAGTVFVDRRNARSLSPAAACMKRLLRQGVPLVLFAEGTSSGGGSVLPFRPALLQPACDLAVGVVPARIAYDVAAACYWGDMTFLPHLWTLLGGDGIHAGLSFGPPLTAGGDRKEFAARLHAAVGRLTPAVSGKHPVGPAPGTRSGPAPARRFPGLPGAGLAPPGRAAGPGTRRCNGC